MDINSTITCRDPHDCWSYTGNETTVSGVASELAAQDYHALGYARASRPTSIVIVIEQHAVDSEGDVAVVDSATADVVIPGGAE